LSRYDKRPGTCLPPVNTLRIAETDGTVRIFHNGSLLDERKPAWGASFNRILDDFRHSSRLHDGAAVKSPEFPHVHRETAAENLGMALGQALFTGETAKTAKTLVSDAVRNARPFQVAVESGLTGIGGLPLETLRMEGLGSPLGLHHGLTLGRVPAEKRDFDRFPAVPGPMKILMVYAAPLKGSHAALLDYERELGKIMDIAESMPGHGDPARKPIVHILDRATLTEIEGALSRNRYHVLHISTHGLPGSIVLENENAEETLITADRFAQALSREAIPPLTVLSACHTAPDVARILVNHGFPYVVAMQDTVTDPYATAFAENFYRKLAYGRTPAIDTAFARTLRELEEQRVEDNTTRSPEDQQPPEWMTPVLFKGNLQQYGLYGTDSLHFDTTMKPPEESFKPGIAHRKTGEFVGRRRQLLTLKKEVNCPAGGATLVTGMGGVGKSTLVSRALADAVRQNLRFTLVQAVGAVTLSEFLKGHFQCHGETLDALQVDFFERRLPEIGKTTVILLDNFEENLKTAEGGAVPDLSDDIPLPELVDKDLAGFLSMLIQSVNTRLIITCRYPFRLPENQHRSLKHLPLGPLSEAETRKLMSRLAGLETLTAGERRDAARTLGGHPRILEFLDAILRNGTFTYRDVQARLNAKLPEDALDALRNRGELSENLRKAVDLAARDCLVDGLMDLVTPGQTTLLHFLSVFQSPRPSSVLDWFTKKNGLPEDTETALKRLSALSLVHRDGGTAFVHRWTAEHLKTGMGEDRWKQMNRLAGECLYEPTPIPLDDGMEAWRHFLESGEIGRAHEVAAVLENQLDIWGHWDLRKGVCDTMVRLSPPGSKMSAGWIYTRAVLSFQQGEINDALRQTKEVLEIFEKRGDLKEMAVAHHQIGIILQVQGDLDGARMEYHKSLQIEEKLGNLKGMAASYHQIGILLQDQGDLDGARKEYHKSLQIFEKLGNLSGMAQSCHQIGILLQLQGDLDGARKEYHKSLQIKEKLGDLKGMAASYHQIGILLQAQGDLDGARMEYHKSLQIFEKLGDLSGMASTYGQQGSLFRAMGDAETAFGLFLQAFELFGRLKSPDAERAENYLCTVALENPDAWESWLEKRLDDPDTRGRIRGLIRRNLNDRDGREREAAESILQLKAAYDALGEDRFKVFFNEQAGQAIPGGLLDLLRSMPTSEPPPPDTPSEEDTP
jgi:tetratricopeptide (TPR) repeat protein